MSAIMRALRGRGVVGAVTDALGLASFLVGWWALDWLVWGIAG